MSFLKENWKVIAITTGVVLGLAAVAATYNNGTSSPPSKKKESSKKKSRKNKTKTNSSSEGPVDKVDLAKQAKNDGNTQFGLKNYEKAMEFYTKAIELNPEAVYFNNRAACHFYLKNYEKAVDDSAEALKRDRKYIKAINRRATSYEALGKNKEALEDYSALCVLEEFKNQKTMASADRVLKVIGSEKAKIMVKEKPERLPSDTFVTAYMESFRKTSSGIDKLLELDHNSEGDEMFKGVLNSIKTKDYNDSYKMVQQVCERDDLADEFKVHALNLRGTFKFLTGKVESAMEDFDKAIQVDANSVDAYIKKASVFMEHGDLEKSTAEFANALRVGENDPDFYYHRGQVRHLTSDLAGAITDFQTALELDPELVYAQIQLGVAQYKNGDIGTALKTFKQAENRFSHRAEVYNYQGEIFLDQGNADRALECFDKCIKMQPDSALPYINKGMLYLQAKGDPVTAESLFQKAIKIDPLSDIAYGPLAQLYLTQNKVKEAINIYELAIQVARTEQELTSAICCKEAACAQLVLAEKYPEIMAELLKQQQRAGY